jgi:hypothetical protein
LSGVFGYSVVLGSNPSGFSNRDPEWQTVLYLKALDVHVRFAVEESKQLHKLLLQREVRTARDSRRFLPAVKQAFSDDLRFRVPGGIALPDQEMFNPPELQTLSRPDEPLPSWGKRTVVHMTSLPAEPCNQHWRSGA